MKRTLGLGVAIAAILTVGYFLIPKNESVIAEPAANKAEIETIIREFILANPEVLIESLDTFHNKQRQEQQAKTVEGLKSAQEDIKANTTSPYAGKKDGDVTVVEFFDYNCGYCKRAFPTIQQLLAADSNIKFIFMELPILSDSSELAARVALAGHFIDNKKYLGLHGKLMAFTGEKNEEALLKIAEEAGYKRDEIKAKMSSDEVKKEIEATRALAQKIGVRGTPAFAVGSQLIPGAVDVETLKRAVAKEREQGKKPAEAPAKEEAPAAEPAKEAPAEAPAE